MYSFIRLSSTIAEYPLTMGFALAMTLLPEKICVIETKYAFGTEAG